MPPLWGVCLSCAASAGGRNCSLKAPTPAFFGKPLEAAGGMSDALELPMGGSRPKPVPDGMRGDASAAAVGADVALVGGLAVDWSPLVSGLSADGLAGLAPRLKLRGARGLVCCC